MKQRYYSMSLKVQHKVIKYMTQGYQGYNSRSTRTGQKVMKRYNSMSSCTYSKEMLASVHMNIAAALKENVTDMSMLISLVKFVLKECFCWVKMALFLFFKCFVF